MISFPNTRPDAPESAPMLWTLQNVLLYVAEGLLGPRDSSKRIFQPVFRENGPILINTPSMDGTFAALSPNAAGYWPTVVYEMAHETVHLLDPIEGCTNWLEEGAAVLFFIEMSDAFTTHRMEPPPSSAYAEAALLVGQLPASMFDSLRIVRGTARRLSAVTSEMLLSLFPTLFADTARRLAEVCVPR